MPVEVKGDQELIRDLESRFGQQAMAKLSETGLKRAAQMFADTLRRNMTAVDGQYRTGATEDEIVVQGPVMRRGEWIYVIAWRGPDDRYRLIHINEKGTVQNPNPPLKGVIARTLNQTTDEFNRILAEEIRKGVL